MKYRFDNRFKYDIVHACRIYGFKACKRFWNTPKSMILAIWNGIGGEGGLKPPKTAYGLNIELSSGPHDCEFDWGETWEDFDRANNNYYDNTCQIIEKESIWLLKWLRKRRAYKYYLFVHFLGEKYFWTPEKLKRLGFVEIPPRPEVAKAFKLKKSILA